MKKQIKWLQNVNNERLDSVWYGGDIVTIIVNDRYYLTITAAGDIRATIKGERYCDKNNGGCFREYLEENGINNDTELKQAIKDGIVIFEDNNWFELIAWDDEAKDYFNEHCDNVVDLKDNDDFKWVEDYLKEYIEE